MKNSITGLIVMASFIILIAACGRESTMAPEWLGPAQYPAINDFSPGTNEGIYPDTSALQDANNPFTVSGVSETGKWLTITNAVGNYYKWATLLANTPTGENQFYSGMALDNLYTKFHSTTFKSMAIRAYQAVLDYFPADVTYDISGKINVSAGVLAYNNIIVLGGTPKGYIVISGKLIPILY